jgi:hypothetical protein
MLETVLTVLLVTLFVLGLFGVVRWVLGFFPRLNATRLNPSVGKWWIILLLIAMWLNRVSELLDQVSPSEWTRADYLNVFYVCALTYSIVYLWKLTNGPPRGESGRR